MSEQSYSARMEALVREHGGSELCAAEAGVLLTEAFSEASGRVAKLFSVLAIENLPLGRLDEAVDTTVSAFSRETERSALEVAEEFADRLLGPSLAGGS